MATTLQFEYPLGSGHILSVPPSIFQQITSGYRIELAGNYFFDIPDGLEVYTSTGFYGPYELLANPSKPKFLLLNEGNFVHSVDPLEEYIGPLSISILQQRHYKVLKVTPIVEKMIQLNVPHGNFETRATPAVIFLCALLQDPCGVKYVLPVVSEL